MERDLKNKKIKILHDRLAEIKVKHDNSNNIDEEKVSKKTSTSDEDELIIEKDNKKSTSLFKILSIFIILSFGGLYIYNLKEKNTDKLNKSKKISKKENNFKVISDDTTLTYKLKIEGYRTIAGYDSITPKNIIITSEYFDESDAKAKVNDFVSQSLPASYFYLPEHSNSKREIYQVYIGPYESKEQAKQIINHYLKINKEKVKIIEIK